jgi:hypothetical protein
MQIKLEKWYETHRKIKERETKLYLQKDGYSKEQSSRIFKTKKERENESHLHLRKCCS